VVRFRIFLRPILGISCQLIGAARHLQQTIISAPGATRRPSRVQRVDSDRVLNRGGSSGLLGGRCVTPSCRSARYDVRGPFDARAVIANPGLTHALGTPSSCGPLGARPR
jgi:hypothetical protein